MASSKRELNASEVSQLANDTVFGDDEIQKAYTGFLKDYPNGKVTVDNMTAVYKRILPNGSDPEDFVRFVFRTFDENGDGVVDFREFVVALSVTRRGSLRKKLEWIFRSVEDSQNHFICFISLFVERNIFVWINLQAAIVKHPHLPSTLRYSNCCAVSCAKIDTRA